MQKPGALWGVGGQPLLTGTASQNSSVIIDGSPSLLVCWSLFPGKHGEALHHRAAPSLHSVGSEEHPDTTQSALDRGK